MRRTLLISLSLVLALVGWRMVCADEWYVIPSVKKSAPVFVVANAQVPRTGQTTTYGVKDDGALQKGVAWPTPRLIDNGNGTVTDNLTGLVWLKNANGFGAVPDSAALFYANTLASGIAGLTDGSKAGDWRLPNIRELESLIDYDRYAPALPLSHPFANMGTGGTYWSSTAASVTDRSKSPTWAIRFRDGFAAPFSTMSPSISLVLCVRGP